jgi:beta-lactamase class A
MKKITVEQLSRKLKWYRILIIPIILFTIVLTCFSYRTIKGDHFVNIVYPLLDPDRMYLDQENYIVNIQDLRDYLEDLGKKYPDSISIYYEQINSGANISINKDLRLYPASLTKLAQAIIVTKKVEEKTLSWNQKLKTEPSDLSDESGNLYKTIRGQSLTVEELMKELLVNSDNTANNIFKHHLDASDYLKFQDATGLRDLYNEKGYISAKEYTRILRVLYTSSYLEPENSQKILQYLSEATFHDYLSQGIPDEIKFAHKYGENKNYNIFSDSGIVYVKNKPYMITVMIKGKDGSKETRDGAVGLMKEISEHAYAVSK